MSVYPLDGARVEDTLGLKICHYQYRWEETFSNGENAGLIPPPRLTKQDMVSIIRQGPVLQYRQWSHFDREWLLRNLGRRFFWIDPCQNLRLGNKTSQGITQQDLMCADPFWKSFCPTKQRSEFSEPTYFASVPDLMWAQPTPFHLIGHTISYLPKLSQALSSILSGSPRDPVNNDPKATTSGPEPAEDHAQRNDIIYQRAFLSDQITRLSATDENIQTLQKAWEDMAAGFGHSAHK
ncbi:unnamed protein product [Penicillium camemberti]|uniref:Str. FM013 n=1 Tax=Penicillium camemberti (strain FM 013) TaxID=1429867 RepID=A0A0G4P5K9_PENC3|nr:unnamed protein product [Penicillium camemberti]